MTDNTEAESERSFAETIQFFVERSESEATEFAEAEETEIPNHAETLVVSDATDLLKTVTSMDMACDMAEEGEDLPEDEMAETLAEDVADLFASLATLQYERDLDIAEAVEDRIEFVEQVEQFQEAMNEAETEEEQMAAMDEHLTDELAEEMGMGQMQQPQPPEPGMNVDGEDYDHGQEGTEIQ